MSEFIIFLQQGFFHILDLNGYDHILFLLAICAIYTAKDWKKILGIITSFTVAHSITLALSVLKIIAFDTQLIEFLIALTIFITCIENLLFPQFHKYRISFSFLFGLIHGMGFSRLLLDLFMGMKFNLWTTLLPFNLGLEAGQFIIISLIIGLVSLLILGFRISTKKVNYIISIPVLLQSVFWMYQRWPF